MNLLCQNTSDMEPHKDFNIVLNKYTLSKNNSSVSILYLE